MTVEIGAIVSDRYRIVEQLGEGGMGAVYRAEHVHMRKMVALKVLLSELAKQADVVARFEREAVAAGSIGHPNVVAATDFGRLADGSFFLVMEYVPGRSLRSELSRGAFAPERAVRVARGILAAVEAAHAKSIVHRDLKPENVMLVERDGDPDFVKVLDFGIAKIEPLSAQPDKASLTRFGMVMGTPEYMAPEQALGQPVDGRSDLYSLGIMLYEMLAGAAPFQGDAVAIMRKQVLEPPPPLPDAVVAAIPGLSAIVQKLLEKEPQNRFASAKDLREALAALDGAPAQSAFAAAAAYASPEPAAADIGSAETSPPPTPGAGAAGAQVDAGAGVAVGAGEPPRSRRRAAIAAGVAAGLFAIGGAVAAVASTMGARGGAADVASARAPGAVHASSASAEGSRDASGVAPPEEGAAATGAHADEAHAEAHAGEGPAADPGVASHGSASPATAAPKPKAGNVQASKKPPAKPTATTQQRKTGPGGIYIPPPRDWFK